MIAIVLIGAITMVLTRSGSTVDQSGDFEQRRIQATQLMRYANSIEKAIERLQTINGCSENDISFENTTDTNYNNPDSPGDNSCHIFEPEGAGLVWQEFGNNDLTGTTSNIAFISNHSITGIGTDAANTGTDLIFIARVSESMCNHLNQEVGISAAAADITMQLNTYDYYFIGSYAGNNAFGVAGEAIAMEGQRTGCMIDDNGDYTFYHVLLER